MIDAYEGVESKCVYCDRKMHLRRYKDGARLACRSCDHTSQRKHESNLGIGTALRVVVRR